MRGSFCQALPIGCMRVFMTPSCSSAVTLESRCSGALNSESSWRRTMSSSWLRVSTSSETMVIRCSSVSTCDADRLVRDLARCGRLVAAARRALAPARRRGALRGRLPRHPRAAVAEGAFELVERTLRRRCRSAGGASRRASARLAAAMRLELGDQVAIVARLLGLVALELVEQHLDAVDGGEDERDGVARDRHAVAELAHQRFGGVRERFEPRQVEEAAGAFDGVDEAEDVVEDLGVVGILLEAHELDVDDVDAFVRLGEEFPQQVVHGE